MIPSSPAPALRRGEILRLPAQIRHSRLGALRHAFTYRADYLLFAPETAQASRGLLRRNGRGLFALNDRDHGGPPLQGRGAEWAWEKLAEAGIARMPDMVLGLLTQPRFLGFSFNPVSFWLLWQGDRLRAVIAEVTNTWRQRHSYLCRAPEGEALTPAAQPRVQKRLHVSPFQDLAGGYRFRFSVTSERVDVLICHDAPEAGLVARLQGDLAPLRQSHLLAGLFTRPGGAFRVVCLIYVEALRLKLRGARWRPLPPAPRQDVSE